MTNSRVRDWHTVCHVYWGEPGIGKSKRAQFEGGPDAYWLAKPNQRGGALWWDGYVGQDIVVIDDFHGWISRDFMQRLCDRYALNVQTKGGNVPFLAKKIIVTSNLDPIDWWPRQYDLGPMARRLTPPLGKIINMTVPWDWPVPDVPDASAGSGSATIPYDHDGQGSPSPRS